MKKISQREARKNRKELATLRERGERQNATWTNDYPGGVHIATEQFGIETYAAIVAARQLGHAVVLKPSGKDRYVYCYGIRV